MEHIGMTFDPRAPMTAADRLGFPSADALDRDAWSSDDPTRRVNLHKLARERDTVREGERP